MDDRKISASALTRVCQSCDIATSHGFRVESHAVRSSLPECPVYSVTGGVGIDVPMRIAAAHADIDSLPLPSKLFFSQIWVLLSRLRVVDRLGNIRLWRSRKHEMRSVTKHRVLDNLDTDFGHRALMKHGIRWLGAPVAAFLLGACALTDRNTVESPGADLPAETAQRLSSVPIPPIKPVPPPRESEVAPAGLAGVVGYDQDAVRDLLGDPIWVEEIPPALSWQYASDECVLRVLFFMEVTTRNFRVLSYDVTSDDDAIDVDQRCLSALVAQADERRS